MSSLPVLFDTETAGGAVALLERVGGVTRENFHASFQLAFVLVSYAVCCVELSLN